MNRSDLIARMTERLGGDRASAVAAVDGVLAEIGAGVARGERVMLSGFGTFERRARAARTARNPRTGEAVAVAASVVPVFRAAAGFKSRLSQPEGASGPAGAPERTLPGLQDVTSTPVDTAEPAAPVADDGAEHTATADGKAATKAEKKAGKKAAAKGGKKAKGKKSGKKSA